LLTAIPLPGFVHQTLSGNLQLLSSSLGVGCLQFIGVMAYQEGNVIDLGPIQLQVVEACSGLRYLFPLMSLSLLCAYLFKDQFWKRAVVFLSSGPIAILLNGFRIGAIGVLVDNFGSSAAEGFGHFFEGWIFFVASLGLVLLEIWLLSRIGPGSSKKKWGELVKVNEIKSSDGHLTAGTGASIQTSGVSLQVWCSFGLIGILALASPALIKSGESIPSRLPLLDFHMQLGPWRGATEAMEKQYLDVLKLDDYLLATYVRDRQSVNLYVGYYESQQKGRTPHSPAACIPGGGWAINSMNVVDVRYPQGSTFPVNRAVIQKGDERQLVLYWFKQRDRLLAHEGLVKFYLFWDSITKHRSDGALVRLVTSIRSQDDEAAAEHRLLEFAGLVSTELPRFVPD
jgi:exosortase D (VPLPA-CTERM-specific)